MGLLGAYEGNLNTLIILRPKNDETANLLIKLLPTVDVVSHTQVSMVSDTPHGEEGVFFNTTNEDRVQKNAIGMLEVSDITSLPKGQAFVLVNGGELYKVRIPLPLNDGLAPDDIKQVLCAINKLEQPLTPAESPDPTLCHPLPAVETPVQAPPEPREAEAKSTQASPELLPDFIKWLEHRMHSGNKPFSLDAQELVLRQTQAQDDHIVFLLPEVLAKYQSRSGVETAVLEYALKESFAESTRYFITKAGLQQEVVPCRLSQPIRTDYSTDIQQGNP